VGEKGEWHVIQTSFKSSVWNPNVIKKREGGRKLSSSSDYFVFLDVSYNEMDIAPEGTLYILGGESSSVPSCHYYIISSTV
jgi:hypothetical protein